MSCRPVTVPSLVQSHKSVDSVSNSSYSTSSDSSSSRGSHSGTHSPGTDYSRRPSLAKDVFQPSQKAEQKQLSTQASSAPYRTAQDTEDDDIVVTHFSNDDITATYRNAFMASDKKNVPALEPIRTPGLIDSAASISSASTPITPIYNDALSLSHIQAAREPASEGCTFTSPFFADHDSPLDLSYQFKSLDLPACSKHAARQTQQANLATLAPTLTLSPGKALSATAHAWTPNENVQQSISANNGYTARVDMARLHRHPGSSQPGCPSNDQSEAAFGGASELPRSQFHTLGRLNTHDSFPTQAFTEWQQAHQSNTFAHASNNYNDRLENAFVGSSDIQSSPLETYSGLRGTLAVPSNSPDELFKHQAFVQMTTPSTVSNEKLVALADRATPLHHVNSGAAPFAPYVHSYPMERQISVPFQPRSQDDSRAGLKQLLPSADHYANHHSANPRQIANQRMSSDDSMAALRQLGLGHLMIDPNLTNAFKAALGAQNRMPAGGPSANNRKFGLYKTELCRSWEEKGSCRYQEKCQFAHGKEELRIVNRHPKYKTEVCRTFWLNGSCPYGKRCCFIHTTVPGNHPISTTEAYDISKGPPVERNQMENVEITSRLRNRMASNSGSTAAAEDNHISSEFGPSLQSYVAPLVASGLVGNARSRFSSENSTTSSTKGTDGEVFPEMQFAGLKIKISDSTWDPCVTTDANIWPTSTFSHDGPRFLSATSHDNDCHGSPYSATSASNSRLFSPASTTSLQSPWTPMTPSLIDSPSTHGEEKAHGRGDLRPILRQTQSISAHRDNCFISYPAQSPVKINDTHGHA